MNGEGCLECEKEFKSVLPQLAVLYYAGKYGLKVKLNDETAIGIHLDTYIPSVGIAIDTGGIRNSKIGIEEYGIKRLQCKKRGIKLYTITEGNVPNDRYIIPKGNSSIDLLNAVLTAFKRSNIYIEAEPEKDVETIRRNYLCWRYKNREYVKEISTDKHYVLSDKEYPVVFEYAGQEVATVHITVNDGNEIPNDSFTENNALLTAESGEDGVFTFENVVYGSYTVRELRPAAGYLENETVYAVTVDKDGDVVEITVVNDLIPEIGTTATIDDENEVCATEVFTLTDTVEYKHLVPGKEYTVKGILMDKATGEPFLQNGEQITSEVTFVPEAPSGSVEVLFTFDAKLIKTNTNIVVFESLYSDSKELTVHADIEDEAQTVTVIVPEIKTEASTDGKKETTIGGEITIEDIVSYHNLTPGKEYVVKGTLMNKTTGKPVTVNDEPVTAEAAFTPETRDGEVKVAFIFNSYVITETTDVVVFESLYREEVEIAVHADIEDEGQSVTVYVPEIKTTASIDGKKEITTAGKVTVEDVVSYTNLIPGTEYTIRGTLMNKATGEVFTVNGETITAEVKFTPKDRNGEVKVKFVFDASGITKSTSLVVFESLYRDDVEITTHKDIEDKDQTVTITPPPDIPKTGDTTNIPLWGALTGISLLGAGVVAFFTFRKKKEENGHER